MRTVEMSFELMEEFGYIKKAIPGGFQYDLPPELGEGGFKILGDMKTCYASIGSATLKKDYVAVYPIHERYLEFGNYETGNVDSYQIKAKQRALDHGLNFQVNHQFVPGYMRMKAGQRIICTGLIIRERFISELPCGVPADFWETAAEVLNPNFNSDMVKHPQLSLICEQIGLCSLSGDAIELFIRGKALESFAIIYDYIYRNRKKPALYLSAQDREALQRLKSILAQNMVGPPSINELSRLVGLNQQKVTTGFKQMTGFTVFGYLKNLRMERALELLQEEDMPISQIAKEVGYHGDGHFQKAFASVFGATPTKVRRELRNIQ